MFPTFLITFREVIEAAVIVSLIIGILKKTNNVAKIKTVWLATVAAFAACFILLILGSFLGLKLSELHSQYEAHIEGTLMFLTVFFITWTVFYLHQNFSKSQRQLTGHIVKTINTPEQGGIFALIFTSVFREGSEIVLFLSTLYLTSTPASIVSGFIWGAVAGLGVAVLFYSLTQKVDLRKVTNFVNIFLVLFAAGLLTRGVHEFTEIGLIPDIGAFYLPFVPASTTFVGGLIKSLFGITSNLNIIQVVVYFIYIFVTSRLSIFSRRSHAKT